MTKIVLILSSNKIQENFPSLPQLPWCQKEATKLLSPVNSTAPSHLFNPPPPTAKVNVYAKFAKNVCI